MDAEEAHQLLAEVRVRCLILEAEKEVEAMRAAKYRNILGTFAGEDGSGATQLEASRVLHAARSALERPTLPAASSSSGLSPEVPTTAQLRLPDSPMVGKKRDSSPAENTARSSKRTRRLSTLPQSTTSEPCGTRTLVPRDRFGVFVEGVFERAGLTPLILTRTEVSLAKKTPDIKWAMFIKLFGGTVTDWPQCPKVPGYEDFLCTSIIAQPFMPLVPGEPGLVLRLPAVIASETPQSDRDKSTFHVLSAARSNGALHYKGKYRKIPLPQIQFTSTNFPHKKSRERWIKRVTESSAMRANRARIELQNKIEREPSASEVQAYMRHQFTDQVGYKEVSAAFRSGKEKLALDGIECIEYDSHLATMIQRAVQDNNM